MIYRRMAVLSLLFWSFCSVAAERLPLKLCYEDVPQPPWTAPDGTGLNFELLKRVEKILGEQFEFSAKP